MTRATKDFNETVQVYGGLALCYTQISEVDFTATAGTAYTPPEQGNFRRIDVSRSIQLLSDITGVVETTQTSAAELRLPANTLTSATNDSGDGRLIFLKNSGTGPITIKDYLGTTLWTVLQSGITIVVGNDNNNWDFYFKAINIPHDTIASMETSTNIQSGLEYLMTIFRDVLGEPTGFKNKYQDSILTFTDATRTLSIAPKTPTYSSFDYYIRGKIYTVTTTHSYQITDTEGFWFFYFDTNGVLQGSQTPWSISQQNSAFVARAYWDATNKLFIVHNEERHGVKMDADTHTMLHRTEGAKIDTSYPQGLLITNYTEDGDGSLNSHAQYGITDGTYFDEDLAIDIKHSDTPSAPFEQILYPIAYVPVFYMTGADMWRKKTTTDAYPFMQNPPNPAYYNMYSGGVWSLQPCTDGYFFATFLVYTDDLDEPVASILGQREDEDLISAVNNNTRSGLLLPRDFSAEMYFYKKLIWQTYTGYGNTPKVRLRYVAQSTEIAAANDRYFAKANYNGNAGAGKYLEFYAGQSSDTSPQPIPESTFIKTLILGTIALNTGTVSIYKHTDLVNSIANISLTNEDYKRVNLALLLNANDRLAAKVSSGSMSKPALTVFFQTNL